MIRVVIYIVTFWLFIATIRAFVRGPGVRKSYELENRWLIGLKTLLFPALGVTYYLYNHYIGSTPGISTMWLFLLVLSWSYSQLFLRAFVSPVEMHFKKWNPRMLFDLQPSSKSLSLLFVWGSTLLTFLGLWFLSLVVKNQTLFEYIAVEQGIFFGVIFLLYFAFIIIGNFISLMFPRIHIPSLYRFGLVIVTAWILRGFISVIFSPILVHMMDRVWIGICIVVFTVSFLWGLLTPRRVEISGRPNKFSLKHAISYSLVAVILVLILWEGTLNSRASHFIKNAVTLDAKSKFTEADKELEAARNLIKRYDKFLDDMKIPSHFRIPIHILRMNTALVSANVDIKKGNFGEALEKCLLIQEISNQYKIGRSLKIEIMIKLSKIQLEIGDYDAAEQSIQKALSAANKHPNRPWFVYNCLIQYAEFYSNRKMAGKALSKGEEADRFGKVMGITNSNLKKCLGDAYLSVDYTKDALEQFNTALEYDEKLKSPYGKALSLLKIGTTYIRMGKINLAYTKLTTAASIAKPLSIPDILWDIFFHMGLVNEKIGNHQGALHYYKESIKIINRMRVMMRIKRMRTGLLSRRLKPYEHAIILSQNIGNIENAFNYVQQAKARTFLDLVGSRALKFNKKDQILGEKEKKLQWRIHMLLDQMTEEMTKPEELKDEKLNRWKLDLQSALKQHNQILYEIKRTNPKLASLTTVSTVSIPDVQRVLNPNEVFLEYFVTDEKILIYAITQSDIQLFEMSLGRKKLNQLVSKIHKSITNNITPSITELNNAYKIILESAIRKFGNKTHIIIAPHDKLNLLPFEALVFRTGTPNYVVDRWFLSYYPSASILVLNRKYKGKKPSSVKPLFAVGDPVFSPMDPRYISRDKRLIRLAMVEEKRGALYRRIVMDQSSNPTSAKIKNRVTLPRLEATNAEVKAISSLLGVPEGSKDIKIGLRASEKEVKKADHTQYRYEHYATHGVLREDNIPGLREPALVFSLPNAEDPVTNEGFLTMSEIFGMKTNADMVVLSACKTAFGEEVPGEGLIGLTRAFMYAGTPSIVASLWNVMDESTARFMTSFYTYLKQGNDKAEALTLAKRELMRQGYYNPYYWAPFILVGER